MKLSLALLLALLAFPHSAGANATVSTVPVAPGSPQSKILVQAPPGEVNALFLAATSEYFSLSAVGPCHGCTSPSTNFTAGPGCTQDNGGVQCPRDSRGLDVQLGDGHDVFSNRDGASLTFPDFVHVDGGDGDDYLDSSQYSAPDLRLSGGPGPDMLRGRGRLEGGPDADRISLFFADAQPFGEDGDDAFDFDADVFNGAISGGPGTDTVGAAGGRGLAMSIDGQSNDGLSGTGKANILDDVENLLGSSYADVLVGSAAANRIDAGGENDHLDGKEGADTLLGGDGNDHFDAADGAVDKIECGAGSDTVNADANDELVGCENVTIVKGALATDLDGDGAAPPLDCNDGNAAIRPGASDTPGNGVDENCDGRDASFGLIEARLTGVWKLGRRTTIGRLRVTDLPSGAKVQLRCAGRGCPFKRRSARVSGKVADLKSLLRRPVAAGVKLEIRVTAPQRVGKVFLVTFRARKRPSRRELCLPPGATTPRAC
jgi:hypothetical protein